MLIDGKKKSTLSSLISAVMRKTKIAILGAGFISDIHVECYHRLFPEAEVVAFIHEKARKRRPLRKSITFPDGMMTWINNR